MSGMSRKSHWERVYAEQDPAQVSWYQPVATKSLAMIRATNVPLTAPIIDVGGGASTLVDDLLEAGYDDISILDIAAGALQRTRARLGDKAAAIHWIEADVTAFEPPRRYAVWHDRAVLHFLVDPADRDRYLATMAGALGPGGHFLVATFGPEGPQRCSGLDVHRYSLDEMATLLVPGFRLRGSEIESHRTPTGGVQQFLYAWWQAATG
jgi:SAM-dependent methyltransferase